MQYTITAKAASVFLDGKSHTVNKESEIYEKLVNALMRLDQNEVRKILNSKREIVKVSEGNISYDGSTLFYKNEPMHNAITDRLFHIWNSTGHVTPLLAFMNNLMENPSNRSVECLYRFVENNDLPITEDGHILAYKYVRNDYTDCHSGTIDNSVGELVEVNRNQVDDDPRIPCSRGLHACSKEYLPTAYRIFISDFASSDLHLMVVKINPRDIVAIPFDYNNSKMRVCRYEVIDELVECSPDLDKNYTEKYSDSGTKLTEDDVLEIKQEFNADGSLRENSLYDSIRELAEDYYVNESTIRKIRDGVTWKHVKVPNENDSKSSSGTKLTVKDVLDIRNEFNPDGTLKTDVNEMIVGYNSIKDLAEDYGVNESTIRKIRDRKIWKDV